jgi:hypothetical protein
MNRPSLRPAEAYLDALESVGPSRILLGRRGVFTENNGPPRARATALEHDQRPPAELRLKAADTETGQVAWFGLVEEHGHPAIMGLRLAVSAGSIAEAETIVCRSMEFGPFPSIETYVAPRPRMLADVPAAERVPRDRMIAVANGYFETLELNDGTLHTQFTDDCDRIENGLQTTNNPHIDGYPIAAMGCAEQFRLGQYIYDDRLRGRRFPLVDEEKGIVPRRGVHRSHRQGRRRDLDRRRDQDQVGVPLPAQLRADGDVQDRRRAGSPGVEAVFITVPVQHALAVGRLTMERLVLHEYARSGNCYKIRLTAAHVGAALERREYDIMQGETAHARVPRAHQRQRTHPGAAGRRPLSA